MDIKTTIVDFPARPAPVKNRHLLEDTLHLWYRKCGAISNTIKKRPHMRPLPCFHNVTLAGRFSQVCGFFLVTLELELCDGNENRKNITPSQPLRYVLAAL